MGSCPQKCSQPQGASQQAHLVLPRAGSPGCFPVAGQSQWSPSQARCGQAIFCEPRCHAVWQAGGGTGQRHDTLSPAAVTESQWCTREPHSGCCGGGGAPSADPGPGSAVRDGGRQGTCQPHAGHPRRGRARLRSSALSGWWNGAEPASRCPCGLCQFQWVMSCPGGGEGSLRSSCLLVLAPKPGLGRPARWRQGGIASAQEGRQGRPGLAPGHRYGGAL